MTDKINPDHYKYGDMEVIEIMEMTSTKEEFTGYLRNNIVKYIFRYKDKNGVEDLEKAKYHLDKLIRVYNSETADTGPVLYESLSPSEIEDYISRLEG